MKKKIELYNITVLRVFAILVVVFGHSMIIYQYGWNIFKPSIKSDFFNNLKGYIDTFQMPLFIFISGYIYYFTRNECKKDNNILKFIKDKFLRLMIPYFSIAILYLIPIRMFVEYNAYKDKPFAKILSEYIIKGKDAGHLWYIMALFGIMVMFCIGEKILKNNNIIIINILILVLIYLSAISFKFKPIFQIPNIMKYFLFFYLGYIVRQLEPILKEKFKKMRFYSYLIIPILLILQIKFYHIKVPNEYIMKMPLIPKILYIFSSIFGLMFYYLLITIIVNKNNKIAENKIIKFLDRESFSIYLFHSPLIYIICYYFSKCRIPPILFVTGTFITIMTCSLIISYTINKIKVLNFVVGKK